MVFIDIVFDLYLDIVFVIFLFNNVFIEFENR